MAGAASNLLGRSRLVFLFPALVLASCAVPGRRSGGWIDVDPGYCVKDDSVVRDAQGLTHVNASSSPCAHPWGHEARMEFIFDCRSVRSASTTANGELNTGYSYRSDPDSDWQRSMTINQDHVSIARFACTD